MMSVLRNDVQIGNVFHGGPSMGTVPGMVYLPHVGDELLHLICVNSLKYTLEYMNGIKERIGKNRK